MSHRTFTLYWEAIPSGTFWFDTVFTINSINEIPKCIQEYLNQTTAIENYVENWRTLGNNDIDCVLGAQCNDFRVEEYISNYINEQNICSVANR